MSMNSYEATIYDRWKNPDQYTDYRVVISNTYESNPYTAGKPLSGILSFPELSFDASPEIGTQGTILGKITDLKSAIGRSAGVGDMVKSVWGTIEGYNGADFKPQITLPFIIIPEGKPYSDIIENVMGFVLPLNEMSIMLPPTYSAKSFLNGVTSGNASSSYPLDNQLIHVTIGEWFHATGLHCTSANATYSKYVDEDGHPLYLNVNMTFRSYRALDAKEFSSWFLR